ncbi:POK9 protein, partial [Melanocharis versteri]|nr:POK9 protein [Melanocharis versteri]
MGALQPSLPNPAMLPQGWHLLIVDLKDCFFTINLHPEDTQRFAFTVPSINHDFTRARQTHATFHQNARGLYKQFNITMEDAWSIVRACPTCGGQGPDLG